MYGRWIQAAGRMVVFGAAMVAAAQGPVTPVRDPLFAGLDTLARNATSVVQVEHGPVTLQAAEAKDAGRGRSASNVYVFKFERDGDYDAAAVKPYEARLAAQGWSCELRSSRRTPGSYRYRCGKSLADGYHEAVTIVVKVRELVFVHSINKSEEHDFDSDDW